MKMNVTLSEGKVNMPDRGSVIPWAVSYCYLLTNILITIKYYYDYYYYIKLIQQNSGIDPRDRQPISTNLDDRDVLNRILSFSLVFHRDIVAQ